MVKYLPVVLALIGDPARAHVNFAKGEAEARQVILADSPASLANFIRIGDLSISGLSILGINSLEHISLRDNA